MVSYLKLSVMGVSFTRMESEQGLHCAEDRPAFCLTSGAFSYFPFQRNT